MLVSKTATLTQVRALGDRQFNAVLYDASEGLDRDGESVDVTSVTAREPVILQADHSRSVLMSLGLVTGIHARGQKLRGRIEFAPEGVSETADQVYRQVAAGVTSSVSIGFLGTPTRSSGGHTTWKDVELIELSFVSVPSSPGAMVDRKALNAWLGRGPAEELVVTREDVDSALPAALARVFAEELSAQICRQVEDQTRVVLEIVP